MLTFRFSQQSWLNGVKSPFTLQVLNAATVIPAHDHLLIPTTRVPPAIVTANPIKCRHILSRTEEPNQGDRKKEVKSVYQTNPSSNSGRPVSRLMPSESPRLRTQSTSYPWKHAERMSCRPTLGS